MRKRAVFGSDKTRGKPDDKEKRGRRLQKRSGLTYSFVMVIRNWPSNFFKTAASKGQYANRERPRMIYSHKVNISTHACLDILRPIFVSFFQVLATSLQKLHLDK